MNRRERRRKQQGAKPRRDAQLVRRRSDGRVRFKKGTTAPGLGAAMIRELHSRSVARFINARKLVRAKIGQLREEGRDEEATHMEALFAEAVGADTLEDILKEEGDG